MLNSLAITNLGYPKLEALKLNMFSAVLSFILCAVLLAVCENAAAHKSDLEQANTRSALAGKKQKNDESCFVRLQDGGPLLAIPVTFWGSEDCESKDGAQSEQWLSFDIHYPEMSRGNWPGAFELYESHQLGEGKAVEDFPARIVWMFFADDLPKTLTDRWNGPEPQVWQLLENAKKYAKLGGGGFITPIIKPSGVKGILSIRFEDNPMPAPDALIRLKAQGWVYSKGAGALIEEPNTIYEFFGSCDDSDCSGHVRLKASHIQYRFVIPPRAKSHLADFIKSTNVLITSWISK